MARRSNNSNDKRLSLERCNKILDEHPGSKKELAKLADVKQPFISAVLLGHGSYNDRIHTFADQFVRKLLRKKQDEKARKRLIKRVAAIGKGRLKLLVDGFDLAIGTKETGFVFYEAKKAN
jgi:hypothetical protein